MDAVVAIFSILQDNGHVLALLARDGGSQDFVEASIFSCALLLDVLFAWNQCLLSSTFHHVLPKDEFVMEVGVGFHEKDGVKLVNKRDVGHLLQHHSQSVDPPL